MGNPISKSTESGTLGELLVQLRLLEGGIQAAPPLKDSGNDLIALRGTVVKMIQVKTRDRSKRWSTKKLPEIYDVLALVILRRDPSDAIELDKSEIYLWQKYEIDCDTFRKNKCDPAHSLGEMLKLWAS